MARVSLVGGEDPSREIATGPGNGPPSLDATWRKVTSTLTPPDAGASTLAFCIATEQPGGCVVVDDAVLRREP